MSPRCAHQTVGWAADPHSAPIQYMGIDHRRADISVPQQFLYSPDVVAVFQEMRGKGMAQVASAYFQLLIL